VWAVMENKGEEGVEVCRIGLERQYGIVTDGRGEVRTTAECM